MNKVLAILLLTFAGLLTQNVALAATATVHATLWDDGPAMGITTDAHHVKAGKVKFEVQNSSRIFEHEMLIIKVNNYHDALPYSDDSARIIEDKVQDFGEISELSPGSSGAVELNLKPGKYLLLCNVPGHFEMGMFNKLIVTP